MDKIEWDDNEWPLAYLITFRTYGTWLHGDERYSIDRHGKNVCGSPTIVPNEKLIGIMESKLVAPEFALNGKQRAAVQQAIEDCCLLREWLLRALHVRTNHVHATVSATRKPEAILNAFKANSTRYLREAQLVSDDQKVWSRGGSTRYLWKPNQVNIANDYVINGQGDDLPNF
jgi:REP element-mobilizing transposase RayT